MFSHDRKADDRKSFAFSQSGAGRGPHLWRSGPNVTKAPAVALGIAKREVAVLGFRMKRWVASSVAALLGLVAWVRGGDEKAALIFEDGKRLTGETVTESRPSPAPFLLTFNGQEYVLQQAAAGQHVFIPTTPADSAGGTHEVVTLNIFALVDEAKMELLAGDIRKRYEEVGKILRAGSKPPTGGRPPEHLIVAILGEPGFIEAAFARIVAVEDLTIIAVYSRRAPAEGAEKDIGEWLQSPWRIGGGSPEFVGPRACHGGLAVPRAGGSFARVRMS